MSDPLEKIIRPIVEGQIRGFLKEHPSIVEAVDWYKPREDKSVTFVNSLGKRIVRDLTCSISRARIEAALLAAATGASSNSAVEVMAAVESPARGGLTARGLRRFFPFHKPVESPLKDS